MKLTILAILAFNVVAADIPDLGVVSPNRAVALNADSLRPGLIHFMVEVRSESSPTNIVTITKTNELLTAADMAQVPSGPGILGVRSVYEDGESDVALYRYDLRRGGIPKPSASPIQVLAGPEPEKSLTNEMRRISEGRATPLPPIPGQVEKSAASFPLLNMRPLPNATNRSYSEHWDWMADRAAQGKRRNE